jgi:hypothetical protein
VGRGYINAIGAATITVASFFPIFTKSNYVSVGNGEKTHVMGGEKTTNCS